MLKIGIIGAGTVGTALAVRLSRKGYPVAAVASRTRASAENLARAIGSGTVYDNGQGVADNADVVFVTTPDGAIGQVAAQFRWRAGQAVVHCSGADTTAVLAPVKAAGGRVGVFHPLQTFASVKQAIENIPGSTFAIEAEEPLLSELKQMAAALEGRAIEIKASDKVLYHAAAVFASNYLVTLVKLATDLWQVFGISTKEATTALLPLIRGTLNNIENVGIPDCLTGPIARGDGGTVAKHLEALEKSAPGVLPVYRQLGQKTVPVALAKGKINKEQADELNAMLSARKSVSGGNR